MGGYLRQSTASQSRALGPFVDDTDFKTLKTGLTIANTDIKLVVNGAASANKNSGGGTHRVNGVYGVTFDATDTATVGEMQVSVLVSGALVVFDKFTVITADAYDALYSTAAKLGLTLGNSPTGTVDNTGFTPTASQFEASDITEATADHYNGRVILFTSGAMAGQACSIQDYSLVSGRGHFSVSTLTEAPGNGVTFIII